MTEDQFQDAFEPSTEFDFFKARNLGKIYVSKAIPHNPYYIPNSTSEKRIIRKLIEHSELDEFVEVEGEILLRCTRKERDQVSVTAYTRNGDLKSMRITLQCFRKTKNGVIPVEGTAFSFSEQEFIQLLKFLYDIKFLDFSNKNTFKVNEEQLKTWPITISFNDFGIKQTIDPEVDNLIKELREVDRGKLLSIIKNQNLSKEDIDILSGRRESVDIFKKQLFEDKEWDEKAWQKFFEENDWILGYGLDYKFLNIIQREASVSSTDLDGSNEVISDFLMGDTRFTVLVELKKPDTQLFEATKNRSQSWRLSKDLMNAVSQILAQKAEWEIKASHGSHFDSSGKKIHNLTVDPKTILIIGSSEQFSGDDRDQVIKAKTFELFRRNSRNIEIITFDELYDKANFIVNNNRAKQPIEPSTSLNNQKANLELDDLPF